MRTVSTQEKFLSFSIFWRKPRISAKTLKSKQEEVFPEEPGLPLYEYRCTSCGYSFEKIQNFSAEPERECPKCHGVLIRPVTAPALRFEGAGWYVNDYAGKGGAKPAETAGATSTDGASGKDAKTESKSGAGDTAAAPTASAAPAAPSTTPSSSSGT
jgi:putative FmdB family regulatory protein